MDVCGAECTWLWALCAADNGIGAQGAQALAEALRSNTALEHLDLAGKASRAQALPVFLSPLCVRLCWPLVPGCLVQAPVMQGRQ